MQTLTPSNSRNLDFCWFLAVFAPPAAGFWFLRRESFGRPAFWPSKYIVNSEDFGFSKKVGRKTCEKSQSADPQSGDYPFNSPESTENELSQDAAAPCRFMIFCSVRVCKGIGEKAGFFLRTLAFNSQG